MEMLMIIFSLKLLILLYISSKSISFTLPPIHETLKYNNKYKKKYIDIIDNICQENSIIFNRMGINIDKFNTLKLSLEQSSLSLLFNNNNNNNKEYNFISESIDKWENLLSINYCDYLFYRYISIDTINYKQNSIDPFLNMKFNDLNKNQRFIEDICLRINDIMEMPIEDAIKTAIHLSLIGSKKNNDLLLSDSIQSSSSKGNIAKKRDSFFSSLSSKVTYILDDKSNSIVENLISLSSLSKDNNNKNIIIIPGKTGTELFTDLFLAYILLSFKVCDSITFQCKSFPMHINGVTVTDVYGHIEHFADRSKSDIWAVSIFGNALRNLLQLDQLRIISDDYWCQQHLSFKNVPSSVKESTIKSKFIILKGEKNYQRILDCHDWSSISDQSIHNLIDSDWNQIPICLISPIEHENIYGISKNEVNRALSYDSGFARNGKFGLIQLYGNEKNI